LFTTTTQPAHIDNLAFQPTFRPPLPDIFGCADYRQKRELLIRIDELIELTDTDTKFQKLCVEQFDQWNAMSDEAQSESSWTPSYDPYTRTGKIKPKWLAHTKTALRSNVLRFLIESPVRGMSFQMADSNLTRWFCCLSEFGPIDPPSKSTIHRYGDWINSDSINQLINDVITQAAATTYPINQTEPTNSLDLKTPIDLTEAWWDGFCLKANIHYPVDWVLLRDICRTLMQAIILIRRRGLKNRMPQEPDKFIRDMNKLVIAMTECRRKKGAKKSRKTTLRKMIALEKKLGKHAKAHRDILDERWAETDLTRAQAEQIINRIDGVLEQIPAAIHQARERIIGERQIKPADKVLSIYERDINIIVRGKADAETEFGNSLRLAEQWDGLIIDFHLYKEPVSDTSAVPFREGVERMVETTGGKLDAVWTDRGFDSEANVTFLESKGIKNGICPKSPEKLREKMSAPDYAKGQRRRASTEGRIGIFQNHILGGLLRTKGFANRLQSVSWAVLAHNFWVLARLPQRKSAEDEAMPEAA